MLENREIDFRERVARVDAAHRENALSCARHVRRVGRIALDLQNEIRLDRRAEVRRSAGRDRPAAFRQLLLPQVRGGFPKSIGTVLICALIAVALLWFGFSANYTLTRDIYFAVAMAHVLAEAPFLLRMI